MSNGLTEDREIGGDVRSCLVGHSRICFHLKPVQAPWLKEGRIMSW